MSLMKTKHPLGQHILMLITLLTHPPLEQTPNSNLTLPVEGCVVKAELAVEACGVHEVTVVDWLTEDLPDKHF